MAQAHGSASELGQFLIAGRREMDKAESAWLATLAEFDRSGDYVLDGHLSAVSWLCDRCGMSRVAASERVRVAHELGQRPLIAEAFEAGSLSFAKVRAMTRITGGDSALDRRLLDLAEVGTAADLERMVRQWRAYADQELRPDESWLARGVRTRTRFDGVAITEITHRPEEAERLVRLLDAYIDREARSTTQVLEDSLSAESESSSDAQPDPVPRVTWSHRRADALADLLEVASVYAAEAGLLDPVRAEVSVLVDYETLVERSGHICELDGGVPLSGDAARRLACDAGIVRIITRGSPKSSTWAGPHGSGTERSGGRSGPGTVVAAPTRGAGVASRRSTTVTPGGATASPTSTSVSRCAAVTTTWSTTGDGRSRTTPGRA